MVFTSPIFMFTFLPVVLIMYFLLDRRFKNSLLLVASLLFYAWGEPKHIVVMLLSIGINYYFGMRIHECNHLKKRKSLLVWAIVLNLLMLVFFKYFNFIIYNLGNMLNFAGINGGIVWKFCSAIEKSPIHLPIGISFFTFQGLSYVVDVYRDDAKVQKSIYNLALYISLFPQLIAGPIVRYHDVAEEIDKREITIDKIAYGIKRFIMGFGKKILIANEMGFVADKIFAVPYAELSTSLAWLGALCYAFQIYFDFSGYSDMAIGLGKVFGFNFLENFNFPYISRSISEFWKRWHISLTNWFRDYVYIPLGGNRKGIKRTYINMFIVFFLSGLWHGASWNFILWGIYYGIFLIIERAGFKSKVLDKIWSPLAHLYSLIVILVGWVLFRAENITTAFNYIKRMFLFKPSGSMYYVDLFTDHRFFLVFFVALIICTPIVKCIGKKLTTKIKDNLFFEIIIHGSLFVILFLSLMTMAATTYNPFIYFRF
ncbi:alginate O-acetyltransferase complex protein AlgI [Hathewaya proteolytica DSM 3090]|uniref:Alginate O-acetyltransferase complex protein AlgI n=1 Tax=Hathewaya proteolytica DSM 3090 TaxID=1121331 RepID=A0A1M6PJ43_9CLOT|nr:MBOAT family O-acyltransferase [Hathewaya proteolytica]SHK07956.1 alginate O-acetyltransferase complex protein AlgI [Hathewaya proteolytica DSM 3090]